MKKILPKPEVFMDVEKGRQCLLDVHEMLVGLGIDYFLILGTALGAYRDKGFVPYEKDIDLGFLQEDFTPRVSDIAEGLNARGFDARLVSRPFHRCRVIIATRWGVKIDMASYIRWKDKRFCPNGDPKTKPYSIVHNHKMLEVCEPIDLFGKSFWIPSPPEKYIALEYGSGWKTPSSTAQDSASKTRIYGYLEAEKIPSDLLDTT